jgi:hypothetical protein
MKVIKISAVQIAMAALAAASIVAGCNGSGSGVGLSSSAQSPTVRSHSIHRADQYVSTTVKIFNQENGTLTGTAVIPPCWSVSPSPIPTVSASPGHSPIITETYDTNCASHVGVELDYNLFANYTCAFTTNYNPSGSTGTFVYSAMGLGPEDNCAATPAPSGANYDEKFIYTIILGADHYNGPIR